MKLCLLSRYFDLRNAGIGRTSMELLKALQAKGITPYTVSTEGISLCSYLRYTLAELPFRVPAGCDIYHALTPMEAIWIPKSMGVVTFYNPPTKNLNSAGAGMGNSRWKASAGNNYFKLVYKIASRARILVCISELTRQYLIKDLGMPEEKTRVIRLGIGEDLRPRPKQDDTFRVGYLGQLDKRKRVSLLIDAFRKSTLNGELVIGGTGLEKEALREQAGRDRRIRFLGFIPDATLVDFYNSLDLFISPTWEEGYGLNIVEAMACRKPVVVLDGAIIPDEVKVRCTQTGSLHHFFRALPDLRVGGKSRLDSNYSFAKSHSWSKCADEYLKVYNEVLEERRQ